MTVEEILKQSGMTDDQIKALDAKVVSGFSTVLTSAATAQQSAVAEKEAAELAKRAQKELYDTQIAPALDNWAIESAQLKAEREFYRTQAQEAKNGGFIAKDAPGYVAPTQPLRDDGGKFVPGGNPVPGSPAYLTKNEGIAAVSNVTWVMSEHQRLYDTPMPDDFETLMNESIQAHRPFREHVALKYKFNEKKQAVAEARQKERDDKIRADAVAANNKEWAEKVGNNPMVRTPQQSQFGELRKGVDAGQRKDPLMMTREQRRASTRQSIQSDIAATDNGGATVN